MSIWLVNVERLVIFALGTGDAVSTVRNYAKHLLKSNMNAKLIRINPQAESFFDGLRIITFAIGALSSLEGLSTVILSFFYCTRLLAEKA